MTPQAIQRVIDALDQPAEWSQLTAVFNWLADRRTESAQGLDDMRPAEIAALPTGSFAHWKPYAARASRPRWRRGGDRLDDGRVPREVDTEDTGRVVDTVRNIGYILSDLDEVAGDHEQSALDVLRMADADEPHDTRATGLDDQLLSWCRRLVGRWSD